MKTYRSWIVAWIVALMATLAMVTHSFAVEPAPAHLNARVFLNPATGQVDVQDIISVQAEGRVTLRLDPAFVVESLSVNGVRRSPERQGETVTVDVGSTGMQTIKLHTKANLATNTTYEFPPFLSLEGGFLGRGWLGHPVGRNATYSIEVTTPLPNIAVIPGQLENESKKNGVYSARFTSNIPDHPPVLISGPFEVAEKMADGVRIRTYFHPELKALATSYLDDAARYIAHFSKVIGKYPYSGFAIVSGPVPVGFGLPGMTYMGRTVLALPFIRATSLPHEILHDWWGNAVGVDYASGNWAEGLTTYMADHAQAAAQAQDGGREKRLEWLRNYAALPSERDQPVTAFQSKTHDATQVVGYDKVAFIFHMLKTRLGPEMFDKAVRLFYTDNRFHTAGWAQVQEAFEKASGENLSVFFDAWLNRGGAPKLTLQDVQVDGQRLTFTLNQVQSGDAYPLTVNALLKTQTSEQWLRLEMDQKSQRYTTKADAKPTDLTIDPNFDVFRRLSTDETPPIFRDVTLNAKARLIVPGNNPEIKSVGQDLADGLMQAPVTLAPALFDPAATGSLIVVGLTDDVMKFLTESGLPLPPASLDTAAQAPGQAIAYVVRENSGRTTLVAMAADTDALKALARVLPHYKRRSFAVMKDAQVIDKGTWPIPKGPLTIHLD